MSSLTKSQHLTTDEIRHGVAGALSVLKAWPLSDQQILSILGARSMDELRQWVTGQVRQYPQDLPHRIGFISGIHAGLRQRVADRRLTSQHGAGEWLGTPNAALGDKRPIDMMTGGNLVGLMLVRDHLRETRSV